MRGSSFLEVDLTEPDPAEYAQLCDELRSIARRLDLLWRESLGGGPVPRSMRLGEASQGVHRALIALQEDQRRTGGILTPR